MSNAYEIFGLEPVFNLDLYDLEARFRRGQSLVHPDRWVTKSDQERLAAAAYAVKLNESYQILKDPLKRAAEFLKAKHLNVPGENGQTVSHSTLLIQVMHWREELENCSQAKQLTALEMTLTDRLNFVKAAFDQDAENLLSYIYLEFVYITKILEEINYHPLRKFHVR